MKQILKHIKLLGVLGVMSLLIVSCSDDEQSVYQPEADFSYEANDLEVAFTSATNYAVSLEWDFGDGASSSEVNPTHIYAEVGDYTVTLTATGEVGADPAIASKTISVVQINPIANFTFEVGDLTVSFTNTSELAVSSEWDFGDGATSNEENPVHTYAEPGEYSVTLTVSGIEGSVPSSITMNVAVGVSVFEPIALENADFSLPGTGRVVNWADVPGWSSDAATVDSGVEEGGWWMPADDNDYAGVIFTGDTTPFKLTDHFIAAEEEFKINMKAFDVWNTPNFTVTLYYNNGDGVRTSMETQTFSLVSSEWNFIEFTTVAPAEADGARLGIEIDTDSSDGGDGWAGFDDVQLFVK